MLTTSIPVDKIPKVKESASSKSKYNNNSSNNKSKGINLNTIFTFGIFSKVLPNNYLQQHSF